MKSDDFGDRMKDYEAHETGRRFLPLLPVYARLDGRSFSAFTRGLDRPFDVRVSRAMIETTRRLVEHTHARIGYVQSDEISLVWLQDRYDSEIFFGGKVHKMTSVLASLASVTFNHQCLGVEGLAERARAEMPVFDGRVFSLPDRVEAANAFLWREQDATKNAVSMAARAVCSHKELHGRTGPQMQELLWQRGVNFNDYPAFFKRGTFLRRVVESRELTPEERERIPAKYRPAEGTKVERSRVVELDMPPFGKVVNRVGVIFDGEEPLTAKAEE